MVVGAWCGRHHPLRGGQEAQTDEGPGTRYILQRCTPSDWLPPARPQLLTCPPPAKEVPSGEDYVFNT
jgi:hypothetical protein